MNIPELRAQAARSLHAQNMQNAAFGINAPPHMTIAADNWNQLVQSLDACIRAKELEDSVHMKTTLPARTKAEENATKIARTLGIYIDSFEY